MKKYLLLLLLSLAGLQTRAQQVIWSQDFEYYYQNNFSGQWSVAGNAGSYPWECGVDYQVGGQCFPVTGDYTRMAGIGDNVSAQGAPCAFDHDQRDVLLITPAISLSGQTAAFFRYDSYFMRKLVNGKHESATVEISTDNGATWAVLQHSPVAAGPHVVNSLINLTPYCNGSNIRLGFRYSDSSEHMLGWMIDNLVVYAPAQNDLALVAIKPSDSLQAYALANTSLPLSARVFNNGLQPVTAFSLSYQVGNAAAVTQTFTGLTLQSLDTATFVCATPPLLPGVGRYPLKVWVSAAGDSNHSNDSLTQKIFGAAFIPSKTVAMEEATGSWYELAPQQHVFMQGIRASDYPASLISLHDTDPMTDSNYVSYIEQFRSGYVPFFYFDRRTRIDPNTFVILPTTGGTGLFGVFDSLSFYETFYRYKDYFAYADIALQCHLTTNGVLSVTAGVKPAINMQGDYRLALVITEDKVQSSAAGYAQQNAYSGGGLGPMGGYEALPDPVPAASMKYDYVARTISPSATGTAGLLPQNMTEGNTYNVTLGTALNPLWLKGNETAIVLLLNAADSSVVNSASVPLSTLRIAESAGVKRPAVIYPNPATNSANLLYYATAGEDVLITATDIQGRTISSLQKHAGSTAIQNAVLQTGSWAPGLYLVTLHTSGDTQTLKLTVLAR